MDIAEAENLLSAPVPWIGMYVAAASLLCTLLMSADVINGFRTKKYWFPCKYFSLNATILALLSVSMKLPMDFTTPMFDVTDRLARLSSVAMLATCMANFLTSLGSLDDNSLLMNVTALAILAVTATVDVFIHVCQLQSQMLKLVMLEELVAIACMLILLVMLASSSLMLSTAKRHLETKYQEMHASALNEVDMRRVSSDELRSLVRKYWVMAETSSPQFVIARCVTCTLAGVVSFLILLILMEAHIRMVIKNKTLDKSQSTYNWSTKWILFTQTMGVLVGTIAPASRWFIAISFQSSNSIHKTIETVFHVEPYWIQKLMDLKQQSQSCKIRKRRCRKIVHNVRAQSLKFLIFIQSSIIRVSKLFLLVSVFVATPIQLMFNCMNSLRMRMCKSSSLSAEHTHQVPLANFELDVGHYVIQLQGEVKLPRETQACISREVDKVILRGNRTKPTNLLDFLRGNFSNFNGVVDFDSHIHVPDINYKHLPNLQLHQPTSPNSHVFRYCWSLPIVTLATIAIALPNIESTKSSNLLRCVTEGLAIVKYADKSLDKKGQLMKIRNAADILWFGIELNHNWSDKELHDTSATCTNSEILQRFSDKAETTVLEFTKNTKECVMRNPMNWPSNVITAYAMHRISKTILRSIEGENENEEEDVGRLFDKISIMIADIISACLTNLPSVITMCCHQSAIEKREKSVAKAALLLGKTQEILKLLHQRHGLPLPTPCQKACIEEWRVFIKQRNNCDMPTPIFKP